MYTETLKQDLIPDLKQGSVWLVVQGQMTKGSPTNANNESYIKFLKPTPVRAGNAGIDDHAEIIMV